MSVSAALEVVYPGVILEQELHTCRLTDPSGCAQPRHICSVRRSCEYQLGDLSRGARVEVCGPAPEDKMPQRFGERFGTCVQLFECVSALARVACLLLLRDLVEGDIVDPHQVARVVEEE